jgi:hypothetical protein
MKPVVIIAIVAVGIVLAVIIGNQQMQINNIETQAIFEIETDRCVSIVNNANPFNIESQNIAWDNYMACMENTVNAYGNDGQKSHWEDIKQEEKRKDMMKITLKENCREEWIGQLIDYNACLDAASLGKPYVSVVEKPEPVSTYSPYGEVRYCNPQVTDCS